MAQRVAILAVERRPVPRRHGGGREAEAELDRARAREISTAKAEEEGGIGVGARQDRRDARRGGSWDFTTKEAEDAHRSGRAFRPS